MKSKDDTGADVVMIARASVAAFGAIGYKRFADRRRVHRS